MKKLILSSIAGIFAFGLTSAQTNEQQLHSTADLWVQTYFSSAKVEKMSLNEGDMDEMYEVKLTDGSKITFNSDGEATDFKSEKGVPAQALPANIAAYLNTNYAGKKVMKYEKEEDEIELKLEDGTSLDFDLEGNFMKIDD